MFFFSSSSFSFFLSLQIPLYLADRRLYTFIYIHFLACFPMWLLFDKNQTLRWKITIRLSKLKAVLNASVHTRQRQAYLTGHIIRRCCARGKVNIVATSAKCIDYRMIYSIILLLLHILIILFGFLFSFSFRFENAAKFWFFFQLLLSATNWTTYETVKTIIWIQNLKKNSQRKRIGFNNIAMPFLYCFAISWWK